MNIFSIPVFRFLSTGIAVLWRLLYFMMLSQKLNRPLKRYKNMPIYQRIRLDSIRVPALAGHFLSALANKKLRAQQYENLLLAGAITPIYDSFFDELQLDIKTIEALTFAPQQVAMNIEEVVVYKILAEILLKHINNPSAFRNESERMLRAQHTSKNALISLHVSDIEYITKEKGGCAFLFYATAAQMELNDEQEQLAYAFGGLVQLLDDVFDMKQDLKHGIATLATKHIDNIHVLDAYIDTYFNNYIALLNKMHMHAKSRKKLYRIAHFFYVCGKTYVHGLQTLQKVDYQNLWTGWNIKFVYQAICHEAKNKNRPI